MTDWRLSRNMIGELGEVSQLHTLPHSYKAGRDAYVHSLASSGSNEDELDPVCTGAGAVAEVIYN